MGAGETSESLTQKWLQEFALLGAHLFPGSGLAQGSAYLLYADEW